jgi:hypothetical protein
MVKFCMSGLNLDTCFVASNQHVSRHVKKLCAEIVASVLYGLKTESLINERGLKVSENRS